VPLLILNLVPVIGSPAYAILSMLFTWLIMATDLISFPLSRRRIPFFKRWQVIWAHRWLAMGFGCAVFLMTFIPGLNLLLLPFAAAGGTVFFAELAQVGDIPAP
jgi:CysZ protein